MCVYFRHLCSAPLACRFYAVAMYISAVCVALYCLFRRYYYAYSFVLLDQDSLDCLRCFVLPYEFYDTFLVL